MSNIGKRMEAVLGDITAMEVDAVVNAANEHLAGGGGVDGAIHRAAGPQLLEACKRLGGCPTGEVRLTPAFDLLARAVIHAVGPVWHGGRRGEEELLASCYRQALYVAADEALVTVAFPAISCGIYGYPRDEAAEVAVRTLAETLPECPEIEKVYLVAYDEEMFEFYEALIHEMGK